MTITTVVLDSAVIQAAAKAFKENTKSSSKVVAIKEALVSPLFSFLLKVDGEQQSVPLTFDLKHREVRFYEPLIACVIARSNPKRLFSFYANINTGHYHMKVTSDNNSEMFGW